MSTDTNPDLIMCGTCGDEFTQHDRGTCGNCMAGETAALHVEIERLTAERDALRTALTELRDRIKAHPAYANLTEGEECDVGGDTAELSYLARVADEALGA